MEQNNRKSIFKNENGTYHIPVFVIVIGFFIYPLLGMGLLIARLTEDKGSGKSDEAIWMDNNGPYAENGTAGSAGSAKSETSGTAFYTVNTRPKKTKRKKKGISDKFLLGVGIFATLVGVININDSIQYLTWCIANSDYISYAVRDVVQDAIWIISGILMIFGSQAIKESKRRRIRIEAIVGKADNMKIAEIAEALSVSRKKAEKYVQTCIDYGIWGKQAYIDMRSDSLVVRGAAPVSNKEKAAREAAEAAEKKAADNLNEYDKVIAELRELNDRIPGEDFSAKISRLEDLTAKIFDLIQKYPDMQGKLRKFINYYLPTSLKLLRNYAQLDAQGIDGENITAAKRKIESTMDTMISAFEKQLDELFYSKNMDISAEIATMENLMKQDGLIDNEFVMNLTQAEDDNDNPVMM